MDTTYLKQYENTPDHWSVFSFSGGPTQLPRYVGHKIHNEFKNLRDTGISILETTTMSHEFHQILHQAIDDLRTLYHVPPNFKMLFCAGGGSILFDAIPMNFLGDKTSASYANTGYWSNRAVNEAKIVCPKLHIATEVKKNENGLIYVPDFEEWSKSDESAYLHYCDNETVEGLEYQFLPKIPGTPLIADMSSNFLTRRANWDQLDMVYAHAQKNIGIAGSTIGIVRDTLLDRKKLATTPYMCDLSEMIKRQSLLNTVPVFPIYVNQQVFSWMRKFGTVDDWEDFVDKRCKPLYDLIDSSHGFFTAAVAKSWRSRVNVTFKLPTQEETDRFLEHCQNEGLIEIKGHRAIGGCRVSLYVPVPQIAIDKLTHVMEDYMERRQS